MNILILEDNLKALKAIMTVLEELELELGKIGVMTFSAGKTAEIFLKNFEIEKFDLILLDYFSSDDKNFHQAVLGKVNPEKIIAISSVSTYNDKTKSEGVSKIVQKTFDDLEGFGAKLKIEIKNTLIF